MTLQEIFDRILIDSGAFLIGSDDIELDTPKFQTLVRRVLGIYSKYCPVDEMQIIQTNNLAYEFADRIPTWISEVTPVSNPMLLNLYVNDSINTPINFVWRYVKPYLMLPLAGTFNVVAVFPHAITAVPESVSDLEVLSISDVDDLFFKILTGYFMVGLGRSRKAFTVNEIPITNDASDMVSEGITMITDGQTALQEVSSKFYLAWG